MNKRSFLTFLSAFSLCVLLILKNVEISEGIRRGLHLCSYSVIPAVFPFMALSVFICKSSASDFISKILRPAAKILKIPESCGKVFPAAIFGGYPAAAKCISDLVSDGYTDRNTASKMLCYCVNAGPSFLIGAVGAGVFGNIRIGFLIFFAQFISALIIAGAVSFFSKKTEPGIVFENYCYKNNSSAAIESIVSAAESCFRMCAFIVIACGITETVLGGPFFAFCAENPFLKAIFSGFFEVTAGTFACSEIEGFNAVITAGAIASFSGISVIFQVAAVTDESKIPLLPFVISRFFHAGITAAVLKIFLCFSGGAESAFIAKGGRIEAVLSSSAPAAVSLLCMAALFLLSIVPSKSEKEPFLSRIRNKIETFRHSQTG